MKIRTTVYSHKVIDVVNFVATPDTFTDDVYDLFAELASKVNDAIDLGGGRVHIKVDRPLSKAELEHRIGVVAKNLEKERVYARFRGNRALELERAEYKRLKAKFEGA